VIPRRELDLLRGEWSLDIGIIEKDYVLGWLLAGIAQHPALTETWVFKGGTCLRKCYYETFRFSEDLDFTVIDGGAEAPDALQQIFGEVGEWLRAESGIELVLDPRAFRRRQNRRGHPTTEGRIAYRGPNDTRSTLPKVKFDLTSDEVLTQRPTLRRIGHHYSDEPLFTCHHQRKRPLTCCDAGSEAVSCVRLCSAEIGRLRLSAPNTPRGFVVGGAARRPLERGLDAADRLLALAINDLRVDTQQHVDTVAGPLGDLSCRHAGVQPPRHRRVTEVIGAPGQRRRDLVRRQGCRSGRVPGAVHRAHRDWAAERPGQGTPARPRYLKTQWHHEFVNEPVLLYSEVADDGTQTRTIEIYRDGHADYVDATSNTRSTVLKESVMPSVEEIDDQPEFTSVDITDEAVEEACAQATGATT
jgi:hypothetical protein